MKYRTAYQFKHLSKEAKEKAQKENENIDLNRLLYNIDGTRFKHSTTIQLT
ncbi:hypothetical protein [Flavobacterium mekongense]|uniref:hypothetical protein n=1 Tax=Flavobacterium mekongense TaxID=3379707 RepID=UPI00399B6D22